MADFDKIKAVFVNPQFYFWTAAVVFWMTVPVVVLRVILDYDRYPLTELCLMLTTGALVGVGRVIAEKRRKKRRQPNN
jgi:uncharacterized membrane protein